MRTVFDITIDFKKSKGSYLYDKKTGKRFLDLFSMFSSLPLGYNHAIFDGSFDEKIKHIAHLRMSNNLCYSDEFKSFEESFLNISFHHNLHFCSTGALAVEAAIKCGYEYRKNPNSIVYSLKNSFHGINSWGFATDSNLSSVKNRVINYPKNSWRKFGLDELIESLENITENISSVIIELIQCTAGDIYLDIDKLKTVQNLCNKNDICFIVDEIQTGFGATGEYWYSKKIGLEPDIIVFGKKSQICGIMTNDKYSEAIHSEYRKLEVTFDGDLIDAVRSEYIIKAIEDQSLLDNVKNISEIFRSELSERFKNYRSIGNLIAFDFLDKEKRDRFIKKSYANHLLVNPTGDRSVRLRPSLSLADDELHESIIRIKNSID
jgi:L-lysine 6-transaminase